MTIEQKRWIDRATYQELLRKWRTAPPGDPMFEGDTGDYFCKVMATRHAELDDAEHAREL